MNIVDNRAPGIAALASAAAASPSCESYFGPEKDRVVAGPLSASAEEKEFASSLENSGNEMATPVMLTRKSKSDTVIPTVPCSSRWNSQPRALRRIPYAYFHRPGLGHH